MESFSNGRDFRWNCPNLPSEAKASLISGRVCGTTEVVPFQNINDHLYINDHLCGGHHQQSHISTSRCGAAGRLDWSARTTRTTRTAQSDETLRGDRLRRAPFRHNSMTKSEASSRLRRSVYAAAGLPALTKLTRLPRPLQLRVARQTGSNLRSPCRVDKNSFPQRSSLLSDGGHRR